MAHLSESFLDELKEKTDIDDVISSYVSLKRRGSTSKGLCPFHNEKTPSFTVYHDTQSFYCFGCGAGGDAVTFIKRIENLDYLDAVKLLAQRAGMQMPQEGFDDSLSKKRRKIFEINRETAKFYYSYLVSPQGKVGLNYFLNRGLNMKTIKKFGLGFAPDGWDTLIKHLKSKGFSVGDMVDAGVVKVSTKGRYYDFFRNRVMTPVIDVRGNVVAFGGRVLDDSKPKYVNTSDTLVYKKTNELFALNLAKDSNQNGLILCEGYMDVIAMHQAGFTNAVAGCGTALTSEQVRLISRYADEVILAYDADEAGQKALKKAVELFKQTDVKIKIPSLVGGKDPDEIIKTYGRDKFKGMLEGASNEIEFALIELRKKVNLNATQGKIDFLNDAVKILANVTPIEQDLYLTRISNELSVEKASLKLQLDAYNVRQKKNQNYANKKAIINESIKHNHRLSAENDMTIRQYKAEERIVGLLYKYPFCIDYVKDFDAEKMKSPFTKKVFSLIVERLNDNLEVELINFSDKLTDSEIGQLSGVIARFGESKNPQKEIVDCINTVNNEYENSHKTSSINMSDDEYRKLFKAKDNT